MLINYYEYYTVYLQNSLYCVFYISLELVSQEDSGVDWGAAVLDLADELKDVVNERSVSPRPDPLNVRTTAWDE